MKSIITIITFISLISINGGLISDLESIEIVNDSFPEFKNWMSYKVYKENGLLKYTPGDLRLEMVSDFGFNLPQRTKENIKYLTQPTSSYKVKNGWLIGFNRGEFGGSLCWFNNDGTKHYLIKKGNVHEILELNGKIFFTQGLAHMSSSNGSISELKFDNKKWTVQTSKTLKACPFQSTIYKDEILIMTDKNIVIADSKLNLTEKLKNGFWTSFYPNSIVIDNDVAYFGMRRGILKLNLNNGDKFWLSEYNN